MAFIKIEFEKGGTFQARLLEDEAPKTCATLTDRMPFEYLFQQSIVSGQTMVAIPPDLTVERENNGLQVSPPGHSAFWWPMPRCWSPTRSTSPTGFSFPEGSPSTRNSR